MLSSPPTWTSRLGRRNEQTSRLTWALMSAAAALRRGAHRKAREPSDTIASKPARATRARLNFIRSGSTLPIGPHRANPLTSPHDAELLAVGVIAATKHWLEKAVIGLNLCPFAKAVYRSERIRYVVTPASDPRALL